MTKIERNELLKKAHLITGLRVGGLVMTNDIGLQFDYVNNHGIGTNIGSISQWPVIRIDDLKQHKIWNTIIQKITTKELAHKDLENTQLGNIIREVENYHGTFREHDSDKGNTLTLSQFLNPIRQIKNPDLFFIILDYSNYFLDELEAFQNEIDVKIAFENKYIGDSYTSWEELSDDELEDWVNRLDNDLDGFIIESFSNE